MAVRGLTMYRELARLGLACLFFAAGWCLVLEYCVPERSIVVFGLVDRVPCLVFLGLLIFLLCFRTLRVRGGIQRALTPSSSRARWTARALFALRLVIFGSLSSIGFLVVCNVCTVEQAYVLVDTGSVRRADEEIVVQAVGRIRVGNEGVRLVGVHGGDLPLGDNASWMHRLPDLGSQILSMHQRLRHRAGETVFVLGYGPDPRGIDGFVTSRGSNRFRWIDLSEVQGIHTGLAVSSIEYAKDPSAGRSIKFTVRSDARAGDTAPTIRCDDANLAPIWERVYRSERFSAYEHDPGREEKVLRIESEGRLLYQWSMPRRFLRVRMGAGLTRTDWDALDWRESLRFPHLDSQPSNDVLWLKSDSMVPDGNRLPVVRVRQYPWDGRSPDSALVRAPDFFSTHLRNIWVGDNPILPGPPPADGSAGWETLVKLKGTVGESTVESPVIEQSVQGDEVRVTLPAFRSDDQNQESLSADQKEAVVFVLVWASSLAAELSKSSVAVDETLISAEAGTSHAENRWLVADHGTVWRQVTSWLLEELNPGPSFLPQNTYRPRQCTAAIAALLILLFHAAVVLGTGTYRLSEE